jgi:hypothetical protein
MLLSGSAKAQDVALKEILLQQTDTGKLDLKKPFYLEVEESKLVNLFDRQPNFGVYHDNLFITGIPINKKNNQILRRYKIPNQCPAQAI